MARNNRHVEISGGLMEVTGDRSQDDMKSASDNNVNEIKARVMY
jgi:hypothetical protein